MVHKFDAKKAGILDDPERVKILDPASILEKLELKAEIVLADLGCGTGFFSIPASRQVKKVFALDIQQEMLDILNQDIHKTLQFIFLSKNRSHIKPSFQYKPTII